jgi:SAM-dependent methyltransferase
LNPVVAAAKQFSDQSRAKRAAVFRDAFCIGEGTRLLDLGSEDGSHICSVLNGTAINPKNVYVADINPEAVAAAGRQFGFTPVVIGEQGSLPFPDGFFDIVYCSSVIEHVTVTKDQVWELRSGSEFRRRSMERQKSFASEIERLGRQYYVQTPNKWFPIDSHTWLPFLGWLPRRLLVPVLRFTNNYWVKKTQPDWNLLDEATMSLLFEGADVVHERALGLSKSVIALRSMKTATCADTAGLTNEST